MRTAIFRLKPDTDLRQGIMEAARRNDVEAGYVVTCVGCLTHVTIRMAGATPDTQDVRTFKGNFEIVSLVGTVTNEDCHLHISFSDAEGVVRGGHLKEGSLIHTTAEIVLGIDEAATMERVMDSETGFPELVIRRT